MNANVDDEFQSRLIQKMKAKLKAVGLSLAGYLHLQAPAVRWLLRAAATDR